MKQLQSLKNLNRNQVLSSFLVFGSRLDVLPANISPLGTFGFFGNPLLFFVSILAFDIGVKGFYPGVLFTYLGFAFYPLLGQLTKNHTKSQLLALPVASFLFFIMSNFGVWWYWYDHTWPELMLCYSLAVPFYTRTLIGDLGFGYGYIVIRNFKRISALLNRSFSSKLFLVKTT